MALFLHSLSLIMKMGDFRFYILAILSGFVSACGSGDSKAASNESSQANINAHCMYYKLQLNVNTQTQKTSLHHVVFGAAARNEQQVSFYEFNTDSLLAESDIDVDKLLAKDNILQELANMEKYRIPVSPWNREFVATSEVYLEDSDLKFVECCGMTDEEIAEVKQNIESIRNGFYPRTQSKLDDKESPDYRSLDCAGTAALVTQPWLGLNMPDFSKATLSPEEGLDDRFVKSHLTTTRFMNFLFKKDGAVESGQCKELPISKIALSPKKQELLEKMRLDAGAKGIEVNLELPEDTLLSGGTSVDAKLVEIAQARNDLTYPNRMIETLWEITSIYGTATDSIAVGKQFVLILPSIINRAPNPLIRKLEKNKTYFIGMYQVPQSVHKTARDMFDSLDLIELPLYFSIDVFTRTEQQ